MTKQAHRTDEARADVFVSYRHGDRQVASLLAHGLEQRSFRVWIDTADVRPGDHWQDRVAEGALNARACVIVVGEQGIDRVQADEVRLVLQRAYDDPDLPIIPVVLPHAERGSKLDGYLQMRSQIDIPSSGPDDALLDRLARALHGLDSDGDARPDLPSPYPGIRPFREVDARFFFGRARELAVLLDLVDEAGLVAVVGPSGVGKSSLVHAGLLPVLRATAGARVPLVMEPDTDPVRTLAVTLTTAGQVLRAADTERSDLLQATQLLAERMSASPRTLGDHLALVLSGRPSDHHVVLVVDQLEQIFTRCKDPQRRDQFIACLTELVRTGPTRAHLVVTVRSDFLGELMAYRELASLVTARHLLVGPLEVDGLRDAVQRPAWAAGISLEPRLVDRVVADVRDQPNALPLLAVALEAMWEHRRGDRLTLEAYEEGGGVRGALAGRAEAAVAPFLPARESLVRATLLRLVLVTEAGGVTRERLGEDDLLPADREQARAVLDLIAALDEARLVVMDRDERSGGATVELSHDAIIVCWDRLARWVMEARQREMPRRRLGEAARNWQANGESRAFLAPAGQLAEAAELVDHGYVNPTQLERDFLEASRAQARRVRAFRWAGVAAAVVAVAAVAATALAVRQSTEDRRSAEVAVAQRLAADATAQVSEHPDVALLLAVEAAARADTSATRSALATTLGAPAQVIGMHSLGISATHAAAHGGDILIAGRDGAVSVCVAPSGPCRPWSPRSTASVTSIALDEDGALGAVVRADGTVAVGPLTAPPAPVTTIAVTAVAFAGPGAPDLMFYGDADGNIGTIELSTGTTHQLGHQADAVRLIAVDPTLNWVLTTNESTAGFTLTGIGSAAVAVTVTKDIGRIYSAAFTSDGTALAVGEGDRNDVVVWPLESLVAGSEAPPRFRLAGHDRPVISLAVTADEIVSGDDGGTVRRWLLARGTEEGAPMAAHPSLAAGADNDGSMLAVYLVGDEITAVRSDGMVIEWDREGRPALARGHSVVPGARAIAAGGDLRASSDASGIVTIARATAGPGDAALGQGLELWPSGVSDVHALALSPDAQRLLVAGHGVAIMETVGGGVLAHRSDGADITFASFVGPTAEAIVVGRADGSVELLDGSLTSRSSIPPPDAAGAVTALAVAPQGLIAVARGTMIEVMTQSLGRRLALLSEHTAEVDSLAFSADASLLASGSDDRTIILWSTSSWQRQRTLVGHTDKVTGLALPTGTGLLVSSSQDGSVRLWDEATGAAIGTPLRWSSNVVDAIASSPSSSALMSLHGDEVVSWDLDPRAWSRLACQIVARQLSEQEWDVYIGTSPYRPACGDRAEGS